MPVYHSSMNDLKCPTTCGASILPLKTSIRGPAPSASSSQGEDIIDEAISFFRANVLFRSFEVEGGADRVLCYLTVYIGQCIRECYKFKAKDAGAKHLFVFSKKEFAIPGESGFALGGFFQPPQDRNEGETFRGYFRQLREELAQRLVELIYKPDGTADKFWMAFSKRSFMNLKNC